MKKLYPALLAALLAAPLHAADEFTVHGSGAAQSPEKLTAEVQVLNFWATWCKPCRQEMPQMSKWYRAQRAKKASVAMVGIAVDSADNVAAFLKTMPVSYPVWIYNGNNSRAMMKVYGNQVGGLPYTVVRMPKCGQQQALLGEVNGAKLDQAVAELRGRCSKK